MKINPFYQQNEEYYCLNCDDVITNSQPNRDGKCPNCAEIIEIKLEIDGYEHSCHRVIPDNLEIGELIALDRRFIREILAIEKNDGYYRIALKEYRAINIDNDSLITRINGGWYR
jgi:DNA-directed RNA polymerase subunit RPC12/RpoP